MPITVVFDPPLPSDSPSTFNTKAFALLGDLNDWSTQANALPAEFASDVAATLAAPPAIGSTTPAAGSFTTLSASDTVSITKAAGVAKAVLTSATGTNEAYYQLVNGGGGYYFGIENNAGSWFGATPYAGVVQAPAGKVVQTVISATPITTVSSSGLAVTGTLTTTGTLGYGTGAGGTVTQATSKSTAVTLNKPSGQITMHNAALGASSSVIFTMTNSVVSSNSVVVVSVDGFTNYSVELAGLNAGNAFIRVTNTTGGALSDAVKINFVVISGASS